MGIERVATKRLDRIESLEKIKKDIENIKESDTWYRNQLKKEDIRLDNKGEGIVNKDFDVFSYRTNLLRKTQAIIKNIEKKSKHSSREEKVILSEDLHNIKIFKESLKKITPREFEVAQSKVVKSLSKDNKDIIKKFNDFDNKKDITKREFTDKKLYLKDLLKRNMRNLDIAKEEILTHLESSKIGNKQREASMESLKRVNKILKQTKKLQKDQGKFLGIF